MKDMISDYIETLINRFSPLQYAQATIASMLAIAFGSAFFYAGASLPAFAAALSVVAHVGFVCFIGPLLRLNGRLGHAEGLTRLLAVLAAIPTGAVFWLLLLGQSALFSIEIAAWLSILSAVLVLVWSMTFVTWAARKHNPFFDLVPWDRLRLR